MLPYGASGGSGRDHGNSVGYGGGRSDMSDASGSRGQEPMANQWYPPQRQAYNFLIETPPSNSRELRNKAEKQRRDRLNAFIGELATLVPMVARSAKKLDKTSILRLTATYLRIYLTLNNNKNNVSIQFPKNIDQFLLDQLVCDQLGGFLLITTASGKIIFVSHTVENLLGHLQTDLMGQSLFNITSPEDHDRLRMYLQCEGVLEHEWKKYFTVRLKRAGPRSEQAVYEPVNIMGMHRHENGIGNPVATAGSASPTSSTSSMAATGTLNNDILVFFVKVCRPEPLLDRLIEASKDEYVTRHLIDGRIINCDQRISIIAGYMTEEVAGNSAFKYMHRDDVRWVIIALRQMYDRGESRGSSCYRLQSRNGQFIFLRTFGFLEIDDQGTVESFVCINTMVSETEGMHLINEMKKRYSALINTALPASNLETLTPPSSNESSVDLVEDPAEVEQAVSHLMHNLPSPVATPMPREQRTAQQSQQDCHTEVHHVITTANTTMTVVQHRHTNQRQEPLSPSANKPFQIKMNASMKRPPEPDPSYGMGKRVKTPLQQLSPKHTLLHNAAIIADIKQQQPQQQQPQPSQPDRVYKHDNLLRQNI